MPRDLPHLDRVLRAAEALLAARAQRAVTAEGWDGLVNAVSAAHERAWDQRTETFTVEDGFLARRVVPFRGDPYQHRCPLAAYEEVAHAAREIGAAGFVLEDLRARTGLPWTQAAVAFAFLKERGVVVPAGSKRHRAASRLVYEEAMIEYHALREPA